MAIVNLTPDTGATPSQLCALRWYLFEQTNFALSYQWVAASYPASVDVSDIIFTSPNGKQTYVQVPVAGEYCFYTTEGVAG